MIMMIKSVLSMMIGFILSLIVGFILIPILKNKKANQSLSVYLEERHKKKGWYSNNGWVNIYNTYNYFSNIYVFC